MLVFNEIVGFFHSEVRRLTCSSICLWNFTESSSVHMRGFARVGGAGVSASALITEKFLEKDEEVW